jgi:hypothetical protein
MTRCSCLVALLFAAAFGLSASAQRVPSIGTAFPPDVTSGNVARFDASSEGAANVGGAFALGTPYPNPFTTTATLAYTLDRAGPIRLELFDALGRRVSLIEDDARAAGTYRVHVRGEGLPPGLYVVRLTSDEQMVTQRLVRGN